MEKKLQLTVRGYIFTLINILFTLHGFPLIGVLFGIVAAVFFIKALKIKVQ